LEQPIVGFHLDSENDWVAELACGHDQHVRHNPPWTNRPWVVTAQGRTSKLGASLDCRKCDIGLPPDRTLMSSESLPGGCRASVAALPLPSRT
jgi:hypothetical protein